MYMKVMLVEILIFSSLLFVYYPYYLVVAGNNEPFRVTPSTSSG